MNKRQKDELKSFLPQYMEEKGFSLKGPIHCINPEHGDLHPSMSYDAKRCKLHCFSCKADYDLYDAIRILEGFVSDKEVFDFAEEHFLGKPAVKPSKEKKKGKFDISRLKMAQEGYDYLLSRGISKKIADEAKIVFCDDFFVGLNPTEPHWKAIIIPTGKESFTARNIEMSNSDINSRYRKYGGFPMIDIEKLYEEASTPVFVVEGEMDWLSLKEAGADCVCLGSINNQPYFLDAVKARKPLRKIILCLDNDEKGRETQSAMAAALTENSIPFAEENIAGEYKDANEALIANRQKFLSAVSQVISTSATFDEKEKSSYSDTSALSFLDDLKADRYISTGFKQMDAALGGGLTSQLYILGGISSLGKSTFMWQIADNIAKEGTDVLFFSLEMSKRTMVAKTLSRLSYSINPGAALTSSQITSFDYTNTPEQDEAYKKALASYSKWAGRVFVAEGDTTNIENVFETINRHISLTGKRPVVFIDYLQLLDADGRKNSDKQNVDICVKRLKRECRSLNIPIVVISSFGRTAYTQEAAFESFKESGGIEYSSDVLLAMQFEGMAAKNFNVNDAKKKPVRSIELIVLKNRNGVTGGKIRLAYMPAYDAFKEQKQKSSD